MCDVGAGGMGMALRRSRPEGRHRGALEFRRGRDTAQAVGCAWGGGGAFDRAVGG